MNGEHPAVSVTWLDSGVHIDHGWASAEKYCESTGLNGMTVHTVGILMHEDEDTVMVGLSYDPTHDTWFGAQLIARQNIIVMRSL